MANNYPFHPGAYPIDTALAAADAIAPAVSYLQKLILGVLREVAAYGATGDEIAARLGWERFRVRPRTSELRVMRKIVDSGRRRKSQSGIASIVWVLAEHAQNGGAA
jgi:hypothetical protein